MNNLAKDGFCLQIYCDTKVNTKSVISFRDLFSLFYSEMGFLHIYISSNLIYIYIIAHNQFKRIF